MHLQNITERPVRRPLANQKNSGPPFRQPMMRPPQGGGPMFPPNRDGPGPMDMRPPKMFPPGPPGDFRPPPGRDRYADMYHEDERRPLPPRGGPMMGPPRRMMGPPGTGMSKDETRLQVVVKQPQRKPARKQFKSRGTGGSPHVKPVTDGEGDSNTRMRPFQGIRASYEDDPEQSAPSDHEEQEQATDKLLDKLKCQKAPPANALNALMCAYLSDGGGETDDQSEAPMEAPVLRQLPSEVEDFMSHHSSEPSTSQDTIQGSRRSRKRKRGSTHDSAKTTPPVIQNVMFVKRRVTLLERLLDKEIRHERKVILQAVQYVVGNNFFQCI